MVLVGWQKKNCFALKIYWIVFHSVGAVDFLLCLFVQFTLHFPRYSSLANVLHPIRTLKLTSDAQILGYNKMKAHTHSSNGSSNSLFFSHRYSFRGINNIAFSACDALNTSISHNISAYLTLICSYSLRNAMRSMKKEAVQSSSEPSWNAVKQFYNWLANMETDIKFSKPLIETRLRGKDRERWKSTSLKHSHTHTFRIEHYC